MSVLEKLRQKKNRPVVPTREDELVSALTPPVPMPMATDDIPEAEEDYGELLPLNDAQEKFFLSNQTDSNQTAPDSVVHKLVTTVIASSAPNEIDNPAISELQTQLDRLPPTARHSTIALEVDLGDQITSYCRQQKITVETFLEATWIALQEHPDVLKQVTIEAKQRYNRRKEAGRLRRLITTIRKQLEG